VVERTGDRAKRMEGGFRTSNIGDVVLRGMGVQRGMTKVRARNRTQNSQHVLLT